MTNNKNGSEKNVKITYYADDYSMGDTSPDNCDRFREWAKNELEREYPEYEIVVLAESSNVTAMIQSTDISIDEEDDIIDFCSRLWDRMDWD